MTSRGLTSAELAAAASDATIVVPLVEVLFDGGPLRLALGGMSITYGGITWAATGSLLSISEAGENAYSTEGVDFEFSGLDQAIVTIAAAEPYRGRVVRIYEAWMNTNGTLVAAPRVEWLGRLTAMAIEEQDGRVVVSGSAEHYEADLFRPRALRYSAADQRRRYPGDAGCDLLESMVDAVIIWPNKEIQQR